MSVPVLIDQDGGIDDALALVLVQRDPRVELVGVGAVHGNVEAWCAARNAARVLELANGSDVPVAVGAGRSLRGRLDVAHPADAVGTLIGPPRRSRPASEHAVEQILTMSHRHAGQLQILALGPLTNLALALRRDAGLVARVRRVVMMGGAWRVAGNASPVAESNLWRDPDAAHAVATAGFADLMVVPLDVTREAKVGRLVSRAGVRFGPTWCRAAALRAAQTKAGRARGRAVHDLVAAAVLVNPEIARAEWHDVVVECSGDKAGMLRAGQSGAGSCAVACEVDLERVVSGLVRTR